MKAPKICITGHPGIGKTTVIKKLFSILQQSNIPVAGFYTEEIRVNQKRQGFKVISLTTQESAILAHVNIQSNMRVSIYGVDIKGFEKLMTKELEQKSKVLLIDEIGKMECFSKLFISMMRKVLDDQNICLIGTIAEKGYGFIQEAKKKVEIKHVTLENRNAMPELLAKKVLEYINS